MKPDWQSKDGRIKLYCGNSATILPKLGHFDACITDPPWGIEWKENGGQGINQKRGKANYKNTEWVDNPCYIKSTVVPIIKLCINLCSCVVVTPGNRCFMLYPQPQSFGAFYQPASVGMQTFGNADAQPILYYGKNRRPNMGRRCSHQITEAPSCKEHPCSKPLKAWTKIVLNTTLENDIICDPFMGSGTTGLACIRTRRQFIGIEIDPGYFNLAVERISKALHIPPAKEKERKGLVF